MKLTHGLTAALALLLSAAQLPPGADRVADNRANALAFYDALIVSKLGAAAARPYMAANFVSHSPTFANAGADAFLQPAEQAATDPTSPIAQWQVEVLRTVAENDFVVIHARGAAGGKIYAIADFLRFDADGKIVEHWDIIQDVSGAVNPAGAF